MSIKVNMFDLHMHSDNSSDGVLSPFEIITIARSRGINMLSITDHNTLAAINSIKWYEGKFGGKTLFINGIELSLYHGDREVHVCAYAFDVSCPELAGLLEIYNRNRVLQSEMRVEKLQDLGFRVEYKEVMKAAGGKMPSGVTLLNVLSKYPENREMLHDYLDGDKADSPFTKFYFDYFTKGGKAYVNVPLLDFHDTVEKLKDKAILVLAHPVLYKDRSLDELIIDGISGIEAYSSYHKPEDVEYFKKFADDNSLIVTAGSDFHGERIKPGISLGGHGCEDISIAEKFRDKVLQYDKGYFYI